MGAKFNKQATGQVPSQPQLLPSDSVTFGWAGFFKGFRATLTIALCVAAYGMLYGMLAKQQELPFGEAIAMSMIMFAGAAQLIVVKMWADPVPLIALTVTAFVVNIRYVLMGATLHPWIRDLHPVKKYVSMFFLVDESWALTLTGLKNDLKDFAFLCGSGFCIYIAWALSSVAGYVLASSIKDPEALGIDFAFIAVFIALAAGLYRTRVDLLPWVVAGVVAIAAAHFIPGSWYIIIGSLAGSAVGAMRHG